MENVTGDASAFNTKKSALLFSLNMVANFLNYVCQIFLAHTLSVHDFGTINIIFSYLLVTGVLGNALTMTVAQHISSIKVNYKDEFKRYNKTLLKLVLATISVEIIFLYQIKSICRINETVTAFLMIILAALSYFFPYYSGFFSGLECFATLGLYSLVTPLYKLFSVAIATVYREDSLNVALLGMCVGSILTGVIGHFLAKKYVGRQSNGSCTDINRSKSSTRLFVSTCLINAFLVIYMNVDLFIVRYVAGETVSGIYSSGLFLGRIVYYFATTIGTMILPAAVKLKQNGKNTKVMLAKVYIVFFVFALSYLVPINILGKTILPLIFGQAYANSDVYIKYISLISVALSIQTIAVNYLIGVRKQAVSVILLALEIALILIFSPLSTVTCSLTCIGGIGLIISLALMIICFIVKDKCVLRR